MTPTACPNPSCDGGTVSTWYQTQKRQDPTVVRTQCPICSGAGTVDERALDLWQAGIVATGATEEDFRSSPNLWSE